MIRLCTSSKKIFFLACFSLLSLSFSAESIENSIIPTVEKYEIIENLPVQKYSKNQFLEIKVALEKKEERIRLVSYNILFDLYDNNLDAVNRWPQRLPRVVEAISDIAPDIMGVQELYPNQLDDLLPLIGEEFEFVSKPCEDGELNGIFYRKERFELVESQIWYMSETPDVPSSDTLTMVQLKDLKTDRIFAVLNTHLSFSKIDKREFQARFIADKIQTVAKKMPAILTGDLNTFPHRLDLEKLPALDGDYIHRILTKNTLKDAKEVSLLGHLGPLSTFTNAPDDKLPFQGLGTPGVLLDHIYVSSGLTVLIHAIQPATIDGHFPSDHMPILIDFMIE